MYERSAHSQVQVGCLCKESTGAVSVHVQEVNFEVKYLDHSKERKKGYMLVNLAVKYLDLDFSVEKKNGQLFLNYCLNLGVQENHRFHLNEF